MELYQVGQAFYESAGLRNGKTRKRRVAVYRCECGTHVLVRCDAIGSTSSCGCATSRLMSEKAKKREPNGKTHGKSKSKAYRCWDSMKQRCLNHTDNAYPRYGGRGIKICDAWMQFEAFYKDMGDPPKGMTIDRINNNGNYEPGNCRWATKVEQNRNRRSNVLLTVDGQTRLLTDWAGIAKTSRSVIRSRMKKGWSDKEAIYGKSK